MCAWTTPILLIQLNLILPTKNSKYFPFYLLYFLYLPNLIFSLCLFLLVSSFSGIMRKSKWLHMNVMMSNIGDKNLKY